MASGGNGVDRKSFLTAIGAAGAASAASVAPKAAAAATQSAPAAPLASASRTPELAVAESAPVIPDDPALHVVDAGSDYMVDVHEASSATTTSPRCRARRSAGSKSRSSTTPTT